MEKVYLGEEETQKRRGKRMRKEEEIKESRKRSKLGKRERNK
jgi:hypothetical protein